MNHKEHTHTHGKDCGHPAFSHGSHTDYLHDGHLHMMEKGVAVECSVPVDQSHPSACTADHPSSGHPSSHKHAAGCGHAAVPHGDHTDFLVEGHLHHTCASHCDDHGKLAAV